MRNLRACLLDEPLARLLAMADAWDVALDASSVKEAADALAAHMLSADETARARVVLPAAAQEALEAVVASNGRMPSAGFERRFGEIRPMGPGRLERERPWLSPANAAEAVWYAGFVFRGFDRNAANPIEFFFVPNDLLLFLGEAKRPPAEPTLAFDDAPAERAAPAPALQRSTLLDDATTLLAFVQTARPRVKADGEWSREARLAAAPMLRDADGADDARPGGRFAFLVRLCERMNWLRVADLHLRLNPGPATDWLRLPPDAQRAALFEVWRRDPDWNDLARADPALKFEMAHAWRNHPLRERAAVLDLLGQWRAGDERQSFVEFVKATAPDFARVDGRYDTWHIRDTASGAFLHGFENWDRVEGALIRYVLGGPLRWLEVTPESTPSAVLSASFEAGPDGAIRLSSALRFERFQLARVADWVGADADSFTYRVSPASLARAAEQGISAARVIDFIERSSGAPAPASLARGIGRWAERGSEARIESVVIVRAKDAAILDRLLDLTEARKLSIERVAPTLAILKGSAPQQLLDEAARNGLLMDWR